MDRKMAAATYPAALSMKDKLVEHHYTNNYLSEEKVAFKKAILHACIEAHYSNEAAHQYCTERVVSIYIENKFQI